ncbi:MAG TPA: hypothetical protein V6D14_08860 [Coleofasciculaceae cyanobacterium]|jgi:hypothetical protein
MELIQSFIEIAETAAKQQALQKNANITVAAHQPTQELAAIEALLFNKPPSAVRMYCQDGEGTFLSDITNCNQTDDYWL